MRLLWLLSCRQGGSVLHLMCSRRSHCQGIPLCGIVITCSSVRTALISPLGSVHLVGASSSKIWRHSKWGGHLSPLSIRWLVTEDLLEVHASLSGAKRHINAVERNVDVMKWHERLSTCNVTTG